jgi:Xaa-Pro aminopeptidase
MKDSLNKLQEAEAQALQLFLTIESRGIIKANVSEKEINTAIFDLAFELFGIEKYWHKRIVRAGANTLKPYDENPPNLILRENEIVFLDFGPIFEDWEADLGRTYVLGNDPHKIKLKNDIEKAWYEIKAWYDAHTYMTGADLYKHATETALAYGWEFGGPIAGHLIGHFPHERVDAGQNQLYIHPDNQTDMLAPNAAGQKRHWILEIHFVDKQLQIGGFFEQLLG